MEGAFEVHTSKTLLEKLRVFEDRRAWSQFLSLYLPMVQAWGQRFGLPPHDVEELTSRLLAKLVQVIPRFEYDPHKGSFRGWLKTITQHEVANLARERGRLLPGEEGTGKSAVYELLLQHADKVDELVAGLHDRSEGLLRCLHDALGDVRSACLGEEQKSWQVFERIFLQDQPIEPVVRELALTYHAAAMRVQRIKKKVKARALQRAVERGLVEAE